MSDPALSGLGDQVELLGRGEVSSRELVQRSLAAIEETQPTLGAFRCVRAEAAQAAADDADRRLGTGERAPLLGVPVAIKDDLDLAGESTQFGCPGVFELKRQDCEAVRRLKGAGAVIVGKTTTPELGQWPITEGSAFGVTRNPWNLQLTPGGSSGGSAAAVAAGLVAGAFGSDGLGSVRIPAAWTHLVGIKPQRGRISTWPEAEVFNGLSCIGPLGRSVADAALLLDGGGKSSRRSPSSRSQRGALPRRGSSRNPPAADRAVPASRLRDPALHAAPRARDRGAPDRRRAVGPRSRRAKRRSAVRHPRGGGDSALAGRADALGEKASRRLAARPAHA